MSLKEVVLLEVSTGKHRFKVYQSTDFEVGETRTIFAVFHPQTEMWHYADLEPKTARRLASDILEGLGEVDCE